MNEQTTTFISGTAGLAGTLTLPDGPGPHRAALLIAGSGPLDRDGNMKRMPLGISRDLASMLADNGWASYRFDKRGVAESDGDYLSTGFFQELADAEAACRWLATHPDVDDVVAIGHSAGALAAAALAGRVPDLAGAVLLAAPAKTGDATLRWQAAQMKDHLLPAPVKALLRLFRTDLVKQQAKAITRLRATTGDVARIQLAKVNAKWMREFIDYDPKTALQRVAAPVLAITGSKDVQVDAVDLAVIAELVPTASETHVLPDVDHILRPEVEPVSNPRRYGKQLKSPIDERVEALIGEWLAQLPSRNGAVADSAAPSG